MSLASTSDLAFELTPAVLENLRTTRDKLTVNKASTAVPELTLRLATLRSVALHLYTFAATHAS